jgi:hypothetical protein
MKPISKVRKVFVPLYALGGQDDRGCLILVMFLNNFLVRFAQLFMERQHWQIGLLVC